MKVTAFVPLKLNNERLPGKNTKRFSNGRALCTFILEVLSGVNGLDQVYVFCSDPSVRSLTDPFAKFLSRSKQLDADATSINDVIGAFASKVESDIYVLAHATAPFISSSTIEKAIEAVSNGEHDCAFTVTKVQEFLWKAQEPLNYNPAKVPRTQDLDLIYQETTGIYVYTKTVLDTTGGRIGSSPAFIEVNKIEAVDINEELDFIVADTVLSSGRFCLG